MNTDQSDLSDRSEIVEETEPQTSASMFFIYQEYR